MGKNRENFFRNKHEEFEKVAKKFGVGERKIKKNARGVEQIVVKLNVNRGTEPTGLLRWPTLYAEGRTP